MIEVEIVGPLVLRVEGQEARLGPMLRALVAALVCTDGYTLTAARPLCGSTSPARRPGASVTRSHCDGAGRWPTSRTCRSPALTSRT